LLWVTIHPSQTCFVAASFSSCCRDDQLMIDWRGPLCNTQHSPACWSVPSTS